MKKLLKTEALPAQVLLLGLTAALLRTVLYLAAMDDKGLLIRSHPAHWLLWLITAAAAVLIVAVCRKLKGSNRYGDNFPSGILPAAGCWIMAVGVVLTVVSGNAMPREGLVRIWKICGFVSGAGLIWAGVSRLRGQRPFVGVYVLLCLFLALQMVSRYQAWSGEPQSIHWIFSMLGAVGLTLTAYQHSAFCAGSGNRRLLLGTSLLAVFFCFAALAHTEYLALYLCGGIWAFASLCRVTPPARRKAAPAQEIPTETE